jgi:selenocysteine lyase/cysteine desulfurase
VAAISAGNNITGNIVDVDRVAVLCHRWGTKAVFDYAAVAPYIPINVGGVTPGLVDHFGFQPIPQADRGLAYKDAVFFSPHKLIGGPQSSGILLAKKAVLLSKKPARAGGGIVFFVNEISHEYVANVEELEEAGTPGVI